MTGPNALRIVHVTSVGAPTESLEKGKTFLADYKTAGYKEPSEAYGAYSYDAANAIIEGAKTALKDAKSVEDARAKMADAVGKVAIDGVTGELIKQRLVPDQRVVIDWVRGLPGPARRVAGRRP